MSAELNKSLKKLKDMGVTISINTHDGQEPEGVLSVMKTATQEAGIYEGEEAR
jgi:biotin operon repressor